MRALVITACVCTLVASLPMPLPRRSGVWPVRTRMRREVPVSSYALPVDDLNKFASPPLRVESASFGPSPPASPPGQDKIATTVVQDEMTSHDGTFSIRYQTSNGITSEMKGSPKGSGQTMEGSYSYTAPDGRNITTRWTADETGFHPAGDHLPTFVLRSG